jgi:outer membrane protein assembly factor BamE
VNFKQYYRAGTYHDAVVKQLRMVERDGRWAIVEEKVLSTLKDGRP